MDAFVQAPVRFCCLLASGPWGHQLTYPFYSSSKALRPPSSPGVFGSLQSFKEDKAKPVRDEYEYVSDDGELKIDEFPIRRKKSAPKRDLSCECAGPGQEAPGSWLTPWRPPLDSCLLCFQSCWTRRRRFLCPPQSQSWTLRYTR